MFYEIRNIKPCYQDLMLRFSSNDPKQWYYLNRMWTCGPSVMILLQWFQSQFSSNEELHVTQECLSPKGLRIKMLIVANSNCNNHSKQIQQSQNECRTSVGVLSKCLKFHLWAKVKKKKIILKNGKDFLCPWTDLSWTMLVS